ncbi:MAG: hypothetical protein FWF06_03530 [Symbiobacteriaceae bacterium]|nr:hypothetical protein [Symbiobacteriaceae bacterium]
MAVDYAKEDKLLPILAGENQYSMAPIRMQQLKFSSRLENALLTPGSLGYSRNAFLTMM